MQFSNNLVSIIIPCFCAAKTIQRAVDSALIQEGIDKEVVIVDAKSTDNSLDVIHQLYDGNPQVKLVSLDKSSGPSGARNHAISASMGDWIAVLDADDWMQPNRISNLLAKANDTHCQIAADSFYLCDDSETTPHSERFTDLCAREDTVLLKVDDLIRRGMGVIKPVFRRKLIEELQVRYNTQFSRGEDLLFLVEIMCDGEKLCFYNQPMYFKQETPGSLTKSNQIRLLSEMLLVFEHIRDHIHGFEPEKLEQAIAHRIAITEQALSAAKLKSFLKGKANTATIRDVIPALRHWLNKYQNYSKTKIS